MTHQEVVGFKNQQGRNFGYNVAFLKHPKLRPIYAGTPEAKEFLRPIEGECVEVKDTPKIEAKKTTAKRRSIA